MVSKIRLSWLISIPPTKAFFLTLASKLNSLNLWVTIGCTNAPLPLPPFTVIDLTLSTSKVCWSTWTASIWPVTTGLTVAETPAPVVTTPAWTNEYVGGWAILIVGGSTTS